MISLRILSLQLSVVSSLVETTLFIVALLHIVISLLNTAQLSLDSLEDGQTAVADSSCRSYIRFRQLV